MQGVKLIRAAAAYVPPVLAVPPKLDPHSSGPTVQRLDVAAAPWLRRLLFGDELWSLQGLPCSDAAGARQPRGAQLWAAGAVPFAAGAPAPLRELATRPLWPRKPLALPLLRYAYPLLEPQNTVCHCKHPGMALLEPQNTVCPCIHPGMARSCRGRMHELTQCLPFTSLLGLCSKVQRSLPVPVSSCLCTSGVRCICFLERLSAIYCVSILDWRALHAMAGFFYYLGIFLMLYSRVFLVRTKLSSD